MKPQNKFSHLVRVQYRDVDSAGHVNNAVYLHYLEDTRMHFLARLYGDYSIADIDFVLVGLTINYHSRAEYGETLVVDIEITNIGRTSWSFDFLIKEKETGRKIASGSSTQVMFDYSKGEKMPIPDKLRAKLKSILGDGVE